MELDELKKSWNALDEQLKKEPIADEKQIAGMIAEYKANARKSIGRLSRSRSRRQKPDHRILRIGLRQE